MKKFNISFLLSLFILFNTAFSAPGDRTVIRTIEYQQRRTGWFDFPSQEKQYQQILVHFKLRCPPGKQCGEWDYLSHVFLNQWYAPSFRADKKVYQQYPYMTDTSWTFSQVIVGGEKTVVKKANPSVLIEFYNDAQNPTKVTDSMRVWQTYYKDYVFDSEGKATDSVFVTPDDTLTLTKKRVYFNDDVTFSDRWEIFRYITPYGNALNLGDGVTWTMDLTDFAPLLTGKVHLESPNGGWGDPFSQNDQEDLELTFEYVEGTPPRNVVNINKLWDFINVTYDGNFEKVIAPVEYNFSAEEKTAAMYVIQTGHGFGGNNDNCSEFCHKLGMAKVDGQKRYEQYVWRLCGENPIFPQNGTWIYDRTNWCPGTEVKPYVYELSPFLTGGGKHTVDYDMEYYNTKWNDGSNQRPYWLISGYLFTYGDIHFSNEARLTEIIAPNTDRIYNRLNPICGNPVIKIQNTGKNDITKIEIKYGNNPDNLVSAVIDLDEPLKFMKETEISLPNNGFFYEDKPDIFYAEIIKVNAQEDEYFSNNTKYSKFIKEIPSFANEMKIEFRTPNSEVIGYESPIQYYLEDMSGNVLYSRTVTENSKTYADSVHLENGCYRFTAVNTKSYGLGFWVYAQQYGMITGYLKLTMGDKILKQFPTDWGSFTMFEFKVEDQPKIKVDIQKDTLNFGNVNLGEKAIKTIEISAANSKGLSISNIGIALGSSKKYSVKQIEPSSSTGKYELKENEKIKVTVEFEPLSAGIKNSQLSITSNDYLDANKNIVLIGKGIDPNTVNENIYEPAEIELSANVLGQSGQMEISYYVSQKGNSANISIYDILGKKVAELPNTLINEYSSKILYDISALTHGVYIVKMSYNGTVAAVPVLISR